jgi:zinc protease
VPLESVEHAMDDVISTYTHRAPSTAELARAKAQLVADATFRRDSQFEMATAYAQALAVGLTAFDVQQWPARIQAIKARSVQDVAADSLDRTQSVTAYLQSRP